MKTTHLVAALVGLVALALCTADASAFYNPSLGCWMQRDPGPGGMMPVSPRVAGGPVMGGGFLPRDPTNAADVLKRPGRMATAVPGSYARPNMGMSSHIGLATAISPKSLSSYADEASLYQYVWSSPVNFVDTYGLAPVNPGKDCGLTANWSGSEKTPIHFWLKGNSQELWDFGPDYAWLDQTYGNHEFDDCGLDMHGKYKYCRGEANWANSQYAGQLGNHSRLLELQGDFLFFFKAKLEEGPQKGTECKCATCADIKACLDKVRERWNGTEYRHLTRSCLDFSMEAQSKCCLE